jgi:hypothetical protein
MRTVEDKDVGKTTPPITRLKWVLGTPYCVQGTNNLTLVPILYFIKFGISIDRAGRNA